MSDASTAVRVVANGAAQAERILDAVACSGDRLTTKTERTAAFLAEHERRMDRLKATRRWLCKQCGNLIAKFRGRVDYVEEPCRKCKTMNELTTEPVTAP